MSGKTLPLDRFAAGLTLALCVVWGFNQAIAKAAIGEVGPITQTGVRSAIGVICVLIYAARSKRRVFQIDGTEAAGALAGILFAVEFVALLESLRWTTAARATVFLYAAPFFVALGAVLFLKDERLRPVQWLGLAFAFLGVVVGLAGRAAGGGWIGDALALFAAATWGATTIVIKATPLRRADPVKVLLYQIGVAALAALSSGAKCNPPRH
jgi:drug/metabolite transporter (DMT)-like permease